MRNPRSFSESFKYGLLWSAGLIWAIPWFLLAAACVVLIVLSPLALVLVTVGAWPLKRIETNRVNRILVWEMRSQVLDEEGEVPWKIC